MSTTLANIITLAQDRLRDGTSNSIDFTANGFRAINNAISTWQQIHDWPWTITSTTFNYNFGNWEYPLPADFKYAINLSVLKYYNKNRQQFTYMSPYKFDSDINYPSKYAYDVISQEQNIKVRTAGNMVYINTMTAYNGDGTFVGAGGVTNVGTDQYEYFDLPGSTSFNFTGTTGTLTNTTMSPKDLTVFQSRSNFYFRLYIPDSTAIADFTSISFKIGSDASNYWTGTITTNTLATPLQVGWNFFQGTWTTLVGTPVITACTYNQFTFNFGSSITSTGFRMQDFFVSENIPLVLTYYSTNFVNDVSAGTQVPYFDDSTATTDTPMWTGRWDVATNAFVNSVIEMCFFMTGQYEDQQLSNDKINTITQDLRTKYPTQRAFPMMRITTDTNNFY